MPFGPALDFGKCDRMLWIWSGVIVHGVSGSFLL